MLSPKKLRNRPTHQISIAGAGAIAVVHALAAPAAKMRVRSVASLGGSSARHLAGNLDARKVAPDALPDGSDILIVATPPDSHEKYVLQGLDAGASVLVEKPLTTTLASADRLVEAVRRAKPTRAAVAENLLHSPIWRIAAEKRHQMGPLRHLSGITVQPPPDWGHFLRPLTAGGVLFDLGPHLLALLIRLAAETPVGVSASLASRRDDGADDEASVELRFESGLVAQLQVSWRQSSAGQSSAESNDQNPGEDTHWSLQAASDDAVLRLEFTPDPLIELNGEPVAVDSRYEVVDPRLETMGYVDQLLDLVSPSEDPGAIDRGQSVEEARMILDVICGAYASAGRDGQEVTLPFSGNRDLTPLQLWRGV